MNLDDYAVTAKFDLPSDIADALKAEAAKENRTLSQMVGEIVRLHYTK